MYSRFNKLLSALLVLFCFAASGQEVENMSSYKNIPAAGYIKLSTDNDYFTGTDQQYTEGINFELVMPWVKDFPLSKLLIRLRYSYNRYGIAVEQAGYTPNNLGNESLQLYDHPYAATLMLKSFVMSTDTVHKQRFATTLSAGVIGPASLGRNIQDMVHALINNVEPAGWKYQVQNDAILNYQVNYQKQLLHVGKVLLVDAEGMARAGTLSDKAGAGADVMLGDFQSPFGGDQRSKHDFHIYVYDNPEVEVVGYDATLQGGVFDKNSVYVIPANDMSRITFTNRMGVVMMYKGIWLEYDETSITKQFSSGPCHLWGSIVLAFTIKGGQH